MQAIAQKAHKYDALVCVDNTFASPVNQNPLQWGVDLVVHSATKYLGGHSDITAGALIGPEEWIEKVAPWRKNLGQMIASEVASLLSRSIRSLVLRVKHQNETAGQIAVTMQGHSKVKKVLYPGLKGFPGHKLAAKQMHGFGGMLTLVLDAPGPETQRVADHLQLFSIAPSLGSAESLCTQPVTTTHHGLSPEERDRRGITSSMLRLSVGFEDPSDLIADLNQALEKI